MDGHPFKKIFSLRWTRRGDRNYWQRKRRETRDLSLMAVPTLIRVKESRLSDRQKSQLTMEQT